MSIGASATARSVSALGSGTDEMENVPLKYVLSVNRVPPRRISKESGPVLNE